MNGGPEPCFPWLCCFEMSFAPSWPEPCLLIADMFRFASNRLGCRFGLAADVAFCVKERVFGVFAVVVSHSRASLSVRRKLRSTCDNHSFMTYKNIRVDLSESIATLTIDCPAVKNALDLETVDECARRSRPACCRRRGRRSDRHRRRRIGVRVGRRHQRYPREGPRTRVLPPSTRRCLPRSSAFRGRRLRRSTATRSAAAASWRSRATSGSPPRTAKFGQPELGLGIIPGAGATQRLPRTVGLGRAKHLVLTGEIIDARQALEIGLVSDVAPAGQLQIRAREMAKQILRQGPLAARLAKLALNASARVDLDSGLLIETLAQAICYSSDDKLEGTAAFLEKRKPKFTGS